MIDRSWSLWRRLRSEHLYLHGSSSSCSSFSTTNAAAIASTYPDLRLVMRSVPSPVVVVTMCELRGQQPQSNNSTYRGVTMSSFTSVSLSPPIVSFCLRLPSQTSRLLESVGSPFIINILSQGMMQHSVHYASPQNQQDFSPFPHYIDPDSRLPVFMNCVSSLVCETDRQLIVGDHQVFFGRVARILSSNNNINNIGSATSTHQRQQSPTAESLKSSSASTSSPLLYYQRSYRSIGDEVFMKAFEDASLSFQQWTHRAHLRMAWNYLRHDQSLAPLSIKEGAFDMIKRGIQKCNAANQHLLKNGYNETITFFYTNLMRLALEADQLQLHRTSSSKLMTLSSSADDFIEFLHRHAFFEDQMILHKFYSKDLLYSQEAMTR